MIHIVRCKFHNVSLINDYLCLFCAAEVATQGKFLSWQKLPRRKCVKYDLKKKKNERIWQIDNILIVIIVRVQS